MKIEPTGKVTVMTGASPHGQGEETTFAQIAADELGVRHRRRPGGARRHGGRAVRHRDVRQPRHGGRRRGAVLRAAGPEGEDEEVRRDAAGVRRTSTLCGRRRASTRRPANRCRSREMAAAAYHAKKLPPNTEPGLVATHFWEPPNFTFPFGAHIVVTEVDRETGDIDIKRYVAVDDMRQDHQPADRRRAGARRRGARPRPGAVGAGRLRRQRPAGHRRADGLRHPARACTCRGSKAATPTTPSPVNPLGVKGVGEAGTIGCSPAVVNSVVDALSPLGVRHIDMPLTPEKIWKLIQQGGRA